jgi:hypothetical protein
MPDPSSLGGQIEAAFADNSGYSVDRAGHSQYLLRYRTSAGIPFGINRTVHKDTRFWLPADERFKKTLESKGFLCHRSEPRSETVHGTGRSSNLDAIPEFKGKPVFWTRVSTSGQALEAASCLK